ncbi:uncharacterized protein LOC108095377 isoform X2 [Drosophila ficusphila]|uniref:uncharacterized protein LOC108095377 isoform X2 n=1 Tax=Drosophila ficusphila TaxID=30025 RepID=UPI0007E634B9|nr:uncharacterized protein LOC108095377 isoform X2 [Drosophila ficusphila]
MKFRLKKFLFFISLRVGCMISALVLFLFELLAVPLRDARPCCDSFEGVLAVVYRVLGIIYFIGCLMLFVASCVRISFLVMIFLSTSLLHTILFPGFLVAEVMIWHANIIDLGLSIGGLVQR